MEVLGYRAIFRRNSDDEFSMVLWRNKSGKVQCISYGRIAAIVLALMVILPAIHNVTLVIVTVTLMFMLVWRLLLGPYPEPDTVG